MLFQKGVMSNRWHFSHYPGISCQELDIIKLGSESLNHKLAKFILYDLLRQKTTNGGGKSKMYYYIL